LANPRQPQTEVITNHGNNSPADENIGPATVGLEFESERRVVLAEVPVKTEARCRLLKIGRRRIGIGLIAALSAALSLGSSSGQQPASISPQQLVRQTVENEIRANYGGMRLMYQDHKETTHGSEVDLIVETTEGTPRLLVESDGKPLTPEQRKAEEARLDALAHNPAELKKKQRAEREDTERENRIMKALPDAFLYEVDGTERGSEEMGSPGDQLVRLRFRSNPNYNPPSRTEQVLTGMRGYVLIDAGKKRIAKIDGTLFKDVTFGWGIFGRLDRGGRFLVQQAVVADHDWEMTRMDIAFTGKELLLKKIVIKSNETFRDFSPAPPNLTFAQGVQLLKKEQAVLATQRQNGSSHPASK
jgi:hypothetical protein